MRSRNLPSVVFVHYAQSQERIKVYTYKNDESMTKAS